MSHDGSHKCFGQFQLKTSKAVHTVRLCGDWYLVTVGLECVAGMSPKTEKPFWSVSIRMWPWLLSYLHHAQ